MNKETKNLMLIILIVLSLFLFFNYINFNSNDYYDYYEMKNSIIMSRIENKSLFLGLTIKSENCSYDLNTDTCYFSIANDYGLKKMKTHVHLINKNVNYISSSGSNSVSIVYDLSGNNEILLYDDNYYYLLNVKFVNNPIINIVELKDLSKKFNDYFDNSILSLTSSEKSIEENNDKQIFISVYQNNGLLNINTKGLYHVRGASSFSFPKKSYKIDLEQNESFFGMKSDNDWILDAVYADRSKVRDRLSSDLWNLINDNQSISNDLNGNFVELFIDGNYVGVYSFKEDLDKKRVNVLSNGLLAKSVDIGVTYDLSYRNLKKNYKKYYYNDVFINSFNIKYSGDYSLENFFNRLDVYYSDRSFTSLSNIFDINNYINYNLFISLIGGFDNINKNFFYSMTDLDSKILITPWDMDLTWGLIWTQNDELNNAFSLDFASDINWINQNITKGMDEKTLSLMKQRYWELRKNVITMDTINGYLDSYKESLVNSGAAKRDSERWYEYDVEFEIEQIREWARRRIEFLDEYFK